MNMPDTGGAMSMGDDSMSMSMVMTFGKWSDYKMQLLFTSWDIKTKSQYMIAWFGVVLAVICWHALKYFLTNSVEESIKHLLTKTKTSHDDTEYSNINVSQIPPDSYKGTSTLLLADGKSATTWKRILVLRIVHALIASCIYGLALMLMLVSMTYNCGLFLALMVGYFLGDGIFFMLTFQNSSTTSIQQHECH